MGMDVNNAGGASRVELNVSMQSVENSMKQDINTYNNAHKSDKSAALARLILAAASFPGSKEELNNLCKDISSQKGKELVLGACHGNQASKSNFTDQMVRAPDPAKTATVSGRAAPIQASAENVKGTGEKVSGQKTKIRDYSMYYEVVTARTLPKKEVSLADDERHWGLLRTADAESLLKNPGDWLVRESVKLGGYAISYKDQNGEIHHDKTDKKSFAEIENQMEALNIEGGRSITNS